MKVAVVELADLPSSRDSLDRPNDGSHGMTH
jgi:hypothetical protein